MARKTEYPQLRRWGLILVFSGLGFVPIGAIVLAMFPPQPDSFAVAMAGLVILGNSGVIAGAGLLALDMKLNSRSKNSN